MATILPGPLTWWVEHTARKFDRYRSCLVGLNRPDEFTQLPRVVPVGAASTPSRPRHRGGSLTVYCARHGLAALSSKRCLTRCPRALRPTFNMAVNLLNFQPTIETAHRYPGPVVLPQMGWPTHRAWQPGIAADQHTEERAGRIRTGVRMRQHGDFKQIMTLRRSCSEHRQGKAARKLKHEVFP